MSKKKNQTEAVEPTDINVQAAEPTDINVQAAVTADVNAPAPIVDNPGMEAVTILILVDLSDKKAAARADLVRKSVEKNLRGVYGDINYVNVGMQTAPLAEALTAALADVLTERIVLMTDRHAIMQPVTLADIALIKAKRLPNKEYDYYTGVPVMVLKSVFSEVLANADTSYTTTLSSIVNAYFHNATADITPHVVVQDGTNLHKWADERWLLPVVSANPALERLQMRAETQRFLFVKSQAVPKTVDELLKIMFA